jgi:hypothetical protein
MLKVVTKPAIRKRCLAGKEANISSASLIIIGPAGRLTLKKPAYIDFFQDPRLLCV